MNIEKELQERSNSACELCGGKDELSSYEVHPSQQIGVEGYAFLCSTCLEQIEGGNEMDVNHWRCLNESMWSEVPGVKVLAWRMLDRLRDEGWAQSLLDMLYLEEETLAWAKAGNPDQNAVQHLDSNGAVLEAGDTVTLIKDLNVKGANFTAKRGKAVRRISLVADNPEHIEGKIDGQRIVILTKFVKKAK